MSVQGLVQAMQIHSKDITIYHYFACTATLTVRIISRFILAMVRIGTKAYPKLTYLAVLH